MQAGERSRIPLSRPMPSVSPRAEGLTHAEVAKRGGSSRTRVTSILNGNLDNVSSDLLIRLLAALGYRVRGSVSRVDSDA